MKQAELITRLADAARVSKANAEEVVKALGEVASAALAAGDEVTLNGIGKLAVTTRAERSGRNPKTGETLQIAAKRAVKFSPTKTLKDALNPPATKGKKK